MWNNEQDEITLMYHEFLSCTSRSILFQNDGNGALSCLNARPFTSKYWAETKRVIDMVHIHSCGHDPFKYFKVLLERNNMWNSTVEKYIPKLTNECRAGRT